MEKFNVYHLNDTIKKSFFLKPRQRFDQSIADEYCITRKQLAKIRDLSEQNQLTPEDYMAKIAKKCDEYWSTNNYSIVAEVKAKDIVQAYRNTNNINGHWFLTVTKGVKVVDQSVVRETQAGDVIENIESGEKYMIYGYTSLNIETGLLI